MTRVELLLSLQEDGEILDAAEEKVISLWPEDFYATHDNPDNWLYFELGPEDIGWRTGCEYTRIDCRVRVSNPHSHCDMGELELNLEWWQGNIVKWDNVTDREKRLRVCRWLAEESER